MALLNLICQNWKKKGDTGSKMSYSNPKPSFLSNRYKQNFIQEINLRLINLLINRFNLNIALKHPSSIFQFL